MAGVTVGLVLIPQAFAYATLAGMPPERGLLVAVAATIFAAPFASSPFLMTGPVAITALLTLGALEGLAVPGSPEWVRLGMLLALMVGVIRLAIGVAGEGGLAYLLSRPVLAGFVPAAAVVIAASQLPTALGVPPEGSVLPSALRALSQPSSWDLAGLVLAGATVAVMLLSKRLPPRLPVVALIVVAGVIVGRTGFGDVAVVGAVPAVSLVPDLAMPWSSTLGLLGVAAVIAVVGFGEAAAIARTYAAETRTPWDPDREFVSQGVANIASAVFGGFPAGGSFSRSAVARLSGARTTWTGAISGLTVLVFLPFLGVLSDLPKAVLAGIIIASVLKLMRPKAARELRRLSGPQFRIALVTAFATVASAPRIQWALIIGIVLAIGWHLRRETLIDVPSWIEGATLHLRPSGVLYFGSAPLVGDAFLRALPEHPDARRLVIHCDRLGRVDVTGALALREVLEEAERAGLEAEIRSLVPAGAKILGRVLGPRIGEPRLAGGQMRRATDRDAS